MVRIAGSLSVAGHLGAFNVAIADVQVPLQSLCESVRPYPARLDHAGLPDARLASKEAEASQAFPVDIFSIIAEIQRSIGQLSERTASVPEAYTYYTPSGIGVRSPVSQQPMDRLEMADSDAASGAPLEQREKFTGMPDGGQGEKAGGRKESAAADAMEQSSIATDFDREIRQSGLAVEQLKGDFVSLTRDLAGVEAAIEEIVRLSLAGNVYVAPVAGIQALPRETVGSVPAGESPYVGPVIPGLTGMGGSPVERPGAGKVKQALIPEPPEFVQGMALGAGLLNTLWGSTIGPTSLPVTVAREIIPGVATRATIAENLLKVDEHTAPGAGASGATGKDQGIATPLSPAAPAISQASPVAQTIETYNTIVNVVKASAISHSLLPMRGATKAEVTQYLLAMPGQPADDRQIKALVDFTATLQANARPAGIAAAPLDSPASASIPGDINNLWLAVRALQDAYTVLQGNVMGPADLIGLQKVVEAMPASAAAPIDEATTPRLNIAFEGVKTQGGSIDLPDLKPVADQFRQMQTMMARLRVPMYGEGGAVTEPTLALIAETGPEVIVNSLDFTAQINSLNNNYASLWTDVIVLRDGIREIVAGVNTALSSAGGGGDEGPMSMDKGYDEMGTDFFQQIADKWLTGHGSASLSELEKLFSSSTTAGFFKGAAGMAVSGAVGVYGMNILEEKLFDSSDKEKAEKSGDGGGGGEGDGEDKEEEEFWDLMDKIDTINTIKNKRQGKFE